MHPGDFLHPVDAVHQDCLGQLPGQRDVEAHLLGPAADDVDTVAQPRRVEADLHPHRIENRGEDVAAADLVLAVGLFLLGDLPAIQLETGQLLGGAGDDHRTPAIADGQHGGQHGADILGELVEQPTDALGVGVGHRHHRRAVAEHRDAAPARHQGPSRTDQLGQGQQLDIARAPPHSFERLDGEHALRMPRDGHRRRADPVHALARQGTPSSDLSEQHAGYRHGGRRQMLVRRNRIFGGQRTYPLQRLEADRAHHDELFCHRFQQQLHLAGQRSQLGLDPSRRHQLFEGLHPGAALATERHRIGLAGRQTVDQRMGAVRARPVAVSGYPVMLVDRHVSYLLYASFRIGSFARLDRRVAAPGCSGSIPR